MCVIYVVNSMEGFSMNNKGRRKGVLKKIRKEGNYWLTKNAKKKRI